MSYATVLLDLDHTLLDSASSERLAYDHAMKAAGVGNADAYFHSYVGINRELWAAVERNELRPDDVKILRFERLMDETNLEADAAVLSEAYVVGLGAHGELYPGTRAVLDAMAPQVTMGLVTNGIGQVQRARIARLGLEQYFDAIAISGELGCAKPGVEIFAHTFRELGGPRGDSAVIVGDSLTSDMQGGVNYGIATCWFNPARSPRPVDIELDHEVAALRELLPLVSGARGG